MSTTSVHSVGDAAIATARRWAQACRAHPEPRAARLLAAALRHPEGLRFTLDFVDQVVRPEDPTVAAAALRGLARRDVGFLPAPLRIGLRTAVGAAPGALLPVVRRTFRALVGDLVVDVGSSLTPALKRLRRGGASLNVNLLGEAVLGDEHARARLDATTALVSRPDVDYVSIKVSSVLGQHAPWGQSAVADAAVERLRPLFLRAAREDTFVNLDMEEYRDLHLTLEVFERLVREPGLRLYVPVVPRAEYDSAISYLVRRLEENAAPENFMSGAASLGADAAFLDREEARFRAALARVDDPAPTGWAEAHARRGRPEFRNTADTDPALPANQEWAESIRAGLPAPDLGLATLTSARLRDGADVDRVLAAGAAAGARWGDVSPAERARLLRRLGDELEDARADLIRVSADEVGKLIDQADVEVSEACDFARYYAGLAEERVDGARRVPPRLVLVASPWNFPLAIPLGGVAAALAAGSAVVLKPAPPARRVAALLAEACLRAGLPADVVQLADIDDGPLGRALIEDPRVGLVVLTGAAETAELFRSWRPGLPLLAETSGKNALVVTPSADLDLAAADLVASAFGHAGQKCSAASLGILVGSVARSRRFRDQVCDAARSLVVAWPSDPLAAMGPLTEPPGEKLLRGLTALEPGQRWLLRPERVGERLWRPGVREGVLPGSEFHQVEYFGPVLGMMSAATLDEALAWQNGTAFGLTAGLHSLDPAEVQAWLDRVEAGNLYVNRSITGAIVRRQPFGGWKRSAVGPGAKAGGPNYLAGFGRWESTPDAEPTPPDDASPSPTDDAWLAAARASDEAAMRTHFANHDVTGLAAEINVLRYRPVPVTVRVEDAPVRDVLREAAAASAAGSPATFSFREEPAPEVRIALAGHRVVVTADKDFDEAATGRVRHLGTRDLLADAGGSIDLAVYEGPSVPAGRVALLPYLREQSVSITNHRFGHPSRLTGGLIL